MDQAQQVLKTRVGPKHVEVGFHAQTDEVRAPPCGAGFQQCDRLISVTSLCVTPGSGFEQPGFPERLAALAEEGGKTAVLKGVCDEQRLLRSSSRSTDPDGVIEESLVPERTLEPEECDA